MIENVFDRDCYVILNEQQPGMIKSIRAGLKKGKSPEEIASKVRSKSGVIHSLILGAAHYLKSHERISDPVEFDETVDFE